MRLVVFDCDGTLVDSQHQIIAAVEEAMTAVALPVPPRETILHAVGLPMETAFRHHAPDADEATMAEIIRVYRAAAGRMQQQDDRGQVMFDGMDGLIRALGAEDETCSAL